MWRYFELLSFRSLDEIAGFKREIAEGRNPRDVKFLLAEEIITRFHDAKAAEKAQQDFISRFAKGAVPDEMPEITLNIEGEDIGIAALLKQANLTTSTSESFRMIKQGAVKLESVKVEDKGLVLNKGLVVVAQVGKRKFARITIK
jgi:tyrosyl-tRNA synthetase